MPGPALSWRRAAQLAAALFLLTAGPAPAQVGVDANISPKRVVFAPADRTAVVHIFNQGDTPATYTVELVDRVMGPDGRIDGLEEGAPAPAGLRSAKSMVSFTPRRIRLEPKGSQAVRVRVQRPADLPAGEYRTHLTVTALPPEDLGLTAEQAAGGAGGEVAVRVVALFSLSIPLVVRQGEPDVRAEITGARLQPAAGGESGAVTFDLARRGASSLYGDVEVRGSGKGGRVLGRVRGLGVYPEIASRQVRVPLNRPAEPGETLTVSFRDDDTRAGTELSTATLKAP